METLSVMVDKTLETIRKVVRKIKIFQTQHYFYDPHNYDYADSKQGFYACSNDMGQK